MERRRGRGRRIRDAILHAGRIMESPSKITNPQVRITKLALDPPLPEKPSNDHDFKPNPSEKRLPVTLFRR